MSSERRGVTQMRRLFAAALVSCLFLQSGHAMEAAGGGAKKVAKAPDFSLKDLKGVKHSLSSHRGEVVLLVFSTTWCPHCRREVSVLKDLHARYRDRGLKIIMVDVMESPEKISSFAEKYGISYTVLLDEAGVVSSEYGVRGIPHRVLIDRDGVIVCSPCLSVEPMIENLLAATTAKK